MPPPQVLPPSALAGIYRRLAQGTRQLGRTLDVLANQIARRLEQSGHSHPQPVPIPIRIKQSGPPRINGGRNFSTSSSRLSRFHQRAFRPRPPRGFSRIGYGNGLYHFVRSAITKQFTASRALSTSSYKVQQSAVSQVPRIAHGAGFGTLLRPKLTGGCLHRSVNGYALTPARQSSARFFSSSPNVGAELLSNVSIAVRALVDETEKHRRSIIAGRSVQTCSSLPSPMSQSQQDIPNHHHTMLMDNLVGSSFMFGASPSLSSSSSCGAFSGEIVFPRESSGPNASLDLDFSPIFSLPQIFELGPDTVESVLQDIERHIESARMLSNDLAKLSERLGELPVSVDSHRPLLRVHFPGIDSIQLRYICRDLELQRGGIIHQDEEFFVPSVEMGFEPDSSYSSMFLFDERSMGIAGGTNSESLSSYGLADPDILVSG